MEVKKNPEVDLEKRKGVFLSAGFVVALVFVLTAFEYKTFEDVVSDLGQLVIDNIEEEIIPITEQEVKPPPPPPPPPAPEIEIVEDDVEVEDIEIQDVEADQTTVTETFEAPPPVEAEPAEPDFFTIVEDMPTFPGGDGALLKYIAETIQYPSIAKENGVSGVVYVSYVVGKDGDIKDVKVVRGSGDSFLDKEASRVVNTIKGYKPGKQRGKPVPVQFTIPIRFVLK